jgi:hypothetical protein
MGSVVAAMCASDAPLTGGEWLWAWRQPAHRQVSSGRKPLPRCWPKDTTTRPGMRRSTRISPIRQSRDERAHDRSTPAQLDQGCTSLPISQPTRGNTSQPNSKTAPPFGNLPLSFLSSAIAPRVRMPHTLTPTPLTAPSIQPALRQHAVTRARHVQYTVSKRTRIRWYNAEGATAIAIAIAIEIAIAIASCTALRCAALCCVCG